MPRSSATPRGDIMDKVQELSMKVFQISVVVTVLALGWFIWSVSSGILSDATRTAAQQKETLETLQTVTKVFNYSAVLCLLSGLICLHNEDAFGVVLLLLGGGIAFGFQQFLEAMGTDMRRIQSPATGAVLETLHHAALGALGVGAFVIVKNIITNFVTGGGQDLAGVNIGRGTAQSEPAPGAIIKAFAKCWQLPFCREAVRKTCPIFHARTKCWKQGVGCMCEQNLVQLNRVETKREATADEQVQGFVAIGDIMAKSEKEDQKKVHWKQGPRGVRIPVNPHVTPQQQKERCRNCIIYNEHQRQKYQLFAPLITLSIPALVFWQYESVRVVAGRVLNGFDSAVTKISLQNAQSQVSKSVTGIFNVEMILVISATLVLLTWGLRLLEHCVFKLKI